MFKTENLKNPDFDNLRGFLNVTIQTIQTIFLGSGTQLDHHVIAIDKEETRNAFSFLPVVLVS